MTRYARDKFESLIEILKYRCFTVLLPHSIYFYTFHKCASTLFSDHILGKVEGYRHKNYLRMIYSGFLDSPENITFKKRGYCYGPIRLTTDHQRPEHRLVIGNISSKDFIRNKNAVFMIRDPRDILISKYFSVIYSHGFSPVDEIRKMQENRWNEIKKQTIDEFALGNAERIKEKFQQIHELSAACKNGMVLKYEDMVENFDLFISGLRKIIPVSSELADEIYMRSRPQKKEDKTKHIRSGIVGDYRNKLKEETIVELNKKLKSTLELFKYEI